MKTTRLLVLLALLVSLIGPSYADTFGSGANKFDIEFVTVGNPGNVADKRYSSSGFGAVAYSYRIGKYEITAGQYTKFLNAVAATDTYGLYTTLFMSDAEGAGARIQQIGSRGNYSYRVESDWANRPVNWVSFWDAVRFVNWLHNGQPIGPQGPGTTEDGAYSNVGNPATVFRRPEARYFIPTEDEWYKAAYYDPNKGGQGVGGYWDYPTGTDATPGIDIDELTNPGNNVNFLTNMGTKAIGWPYQRTEVGEFELSASPYGTFDQAGNVWEWSEDRRYDPARQWDERGTRGGSHGSLAHQMVASYRSKTLPELQFPNLGFRIASIAIPEPSTALLALASLLCLAKRTRKSL